VLVAERQSAGMTQRDLAERLHRHQSFLGKIEGGLRTIDVIEFVEVARALNIEPTKLLAKVVKATGL
jgi:transcriptional regulator with XRE-family HTH domain